MPPRTDLLQRTLEFWRRLGRLLRRGEVEAEMREEFRTHLELETEHLMKTRGLTRAAASRAAHVAFGGVARFEERSRDVRGVRAVEEFVRDVRHSGRLLARSPMFAGVTVLTLALGIGGLSAIFAVLNGIVLKPLPYRDVDRLVTLHHVVPSEGPESRAISLAAYHRYRAVGRSIEELAGYRESALNLEGEEGAERIRIADATHELFTLLGARPVLGRLYDASDWTGSDMDVNWTIPVLLSYDFWQSRFGGDPAVLGRILRINDRPREVMGVLPPDFAFPSRETQVWRMTMPSPPRAGSGVVVAAYNTVGRLRSGATVAGAQEEYGRILAAMEEEFASSGLTVPVQRPVVRPIREHVLGEAAGVLWIVFGSVLLLLLVACANVANLFAVRAETRAREIAIRTSLGASRLRLAWLFLAESILVSLGGAVLGLVLAFGTVRVVLALAPEQLPRLDAVRLDRSTVLFTLAVAALVALLLALLSLVRHMRTTDSASTLRTGRSGAGVERQQRRVLDGMMAVQVALTIALLAGSALMLRSYRNIMSAERGFDSAGVLTVEVGVPFRAATRHHALYDDVARRMRAIPGVTGVGGISVLPLTGGGPEEVIRAVGPERGTAEPVAFRFFFPGWFEAMRTPVLDGVGFAPGETVPHAHPVVVSEALARRLFPDGGAIGGRLVRVDARGEPVDMFDPETRQAIPLPAYTIAGIVANVRDEALQAQPGETLYIPIIEPSVEQSIMPVELAFALRTTVPPMNIAESARRAVHDVDRTMSVARIRTMDDIVAAATARERFLAALLLMAATTSLLLGIVGIYGIVAWTVRRRTAEIGVRIALGARPAAVTWLVLRQTLAVVLAGAAAGVALALGGSHVLQAALYEVSPTDPLVIASVTLLLIAAAAAASLAPALRAARLDPATVLRAE